MSKNETLELLTGLVGKRSFIKCLAFDNYYYNDSACVEIFTYDDYVYYKEYLLIGEIELHDIQLINGIDNYYLITFKDLFVRC